MSITYRRISPEDEAAVFGLRMRTWGSPDIEHVRRRAYADPNYSKHIYGAFAPDGTVLSTAGYWLRRIRDAGGHPCLVGCVVSVVTIEEARRQGHARTLMQMAHETMRSEGCEWAFLFSSAMGVPLYESLGYRLYPAPYFLGYCEVTLQMEQPGTRQGAGSAWNDVYRVQRIETPFDMADRSWRAIRRIYASYNAHRSLSLVRDEDYWSGYFASELGPTPWADTPYVFTASINNQPVAYLVAQMLSTESARHFFNTEEGFFIREVGLMPGHAPALQIILSVARNQLILSRSPTPSRKQVPALPGAAFLPREAAVEDSIQTLFNRSLSMSSERRRTMALPLGDRFNESDLKAAFEAPGAHFGHMDTF